MDHDALSNHTVAETIFPGYEYKRRGVDGVFNEYPEHVYESLQNHPRRSWGRYAYRLVRRTRPNNSVWNPLENTIEKLKKRRGNRNSFELGVGASDDDDMLEIPLYDDNADGLRFRPMPCLSHLSFHVFGRDRLNLTALYRSHYYVQRLYGNLLGLARLQEFVATQAGLTVGELVCHSTFARLEYGKPRDGARWKKIEVIRLLDAARAIYTDAADTHNQLRASTTP
ncbi:hypothetical protein [Sorangium sp. So ce1182]|uniref:hypothetical protein n=1 Tax=Sorangium sp. So ce1182 TaxID=3133334 RepID=UPI003F62000A